PGRHALPPPSLGGAALLPPHVPADRAWVGDQPAPAGHVGGGDRGGPGAVGECRGRRGRWWGRALSHGSIVYHSRARARKIPDMAPDTRTLVCRGVTTCARTRSAPTAAALTSTTPTAGRACWKRPATGGPGTPTPRTSWSSTPARCGRTPTTGCTGTSVTCCR